MMIAACWESQAKRRSSKDFRSRVSLFIDGVMLISPSSSTLGPVDVPKRGGAAGRAFELFGYAG
jgi:hypothetical protein